MTDIEISFQKAVQAFNSSDLDLAIELFKTIISQSPDYVDAHSYLGQAHFKKGDYQDSVNCLKKALEIDPDHVQAKEILEVIQWKMESLSEATSEPADNIENLDQDTLKNSSDLSNQDLIPVSTERENQIDTDTSIDTDVTESGQSQLIRNAQITLMARRALKGRWTKSALDTLVYVLILVGTGYISRQVSRPLLSLLLDTELGVKLEFPYSLLNDFLSGFLHSFVSAPLILGYKGIYMLTAYRKKRYQLDLIFAGFSFQYYFLVLSAYWITTAFTVVGFVCLIIPGIIIFFSLEMVNFIIVDDRDISPFEALKKSYQMMKGFKWKFCCLGLRFIGWFILGIVTIGIGFLWISPYYLMSVAIFYENISGASKSQSPQSLEPEAVIS